MSTKTSSKTGKNAGLSVTTEDIRDESLPTTEAETYTEDSEIAMPMVAGKSAPITPSDIILPTLRIAHNVGALGDDFQKGSLVVDGQTQVTEFFPKEENSTAIEVTVLGYTKSFVENVPYGSGVIAQRLYDEAQIADMKKTTEYWTDDSGDRQPPHFFPTLDLRILVKRPTDDKIKTMNPSSSEMEAGAIASTHFPFSYDGDDYAMLAWTLQRSGYTRAGKRILSAYANQIFPCVHCGRFILSTEISKFGGNKTFVPNLQYGPKHDDKFVEWVASMA
tara:strand:+ start:1501 stop:2331 length:831 start_codon:yes stop_codon:yes gene_type:complete